MPIKLIANLCKFMSSAVFRASFMLAAFSLENQTHFKNVFYISCDTSHDETFLESAFYSIHITNHNSIIGGNKESNPLGFKSALDIRKIGRVRNSRTLDGALTKRFECLMGSS